MIVTINIDNRVAGKPNEFDAVFTYSFELESLIDAEYHLERVFLSAGYSKETIDRLFNKEEF